MAAGKRILLIEDDTETAELIAEDLQERGAAAPAAQGPRHRVLFA